MSIDVNTAKELFRKAFGGDAELVVRAPGRVNIIGEHTDYNHGFVLPMAIEHETVICARKRPDRLIEAVAANLDRRATADLDKRGRNAEEPWLDYVVGVAEEVDKIDRPLTGCDILIFGDVPLGCGLSSSASLEMAALCLLEALGGFSMDSAEAARLGQRVENDFLGLSSGIMDQFISRGGKKGHALFLDCRSFDYELIPVAFPSAVFVIANTCCSRGLTASKYNERVAECGEAVKVLARRADGEGSHLRDFTLGDLDAARKVLPKTAYRRARHVISEDDRTLQACEVMRAGDARRLGELMDASDHSLREDYEVTSMELDTMTRIARTLPGCHGARMTGAGFGGCTINLVEKDAVENFCTALLEGYKKETGLEGETFVSEPANGAGRAQ